MCNRDPPNPPVPKRFNSFFASNVIFTYLATVYDVDHPPFLQERQRFKSAYFVANNPKDAT